MRQSLTGFARSLHARIMLLVGAAAFFASITIAGLDFARISDISIRSAIESFGTETRLVTSQLDQVFDQMRSDVRILAATPPIDGLIRTRDADGIDPLDGSTAELWRTRLETIFASMLENKPHYFQIRLIGLAYGGREIVRVDRSDAGIEPMATTGLQRKGEESYFGLGTSLAQGVTQFSDVNYNREYGRVDPTETPTIRVVMPVFSSGGQRFGMLVINADYEQMLQGALHKIAPPHNTIIANAAGDYLTYRARSGYSRLLPSFSSDYRAHPAVLRSWEMPEGSVIELDGSIYYFLRADIGRGDAGKSLTIMIHETQEALLANAYQARREGLAAAAIIAIVSTIVAAALAGRLLRPMRRMTAEIRSSGSAARDLNLPVGEKDEIGELARAFATMTSGLQTSETKMRTVMDSVLDGLIVIDEAGRIDSYNSACETIFGYSSEETLGQNISMLMPEPHRGAHDGYLEAYRNGGSGKIIGVGRELEGQRKDGTVFPIDLSVSEIRLGDRRLYCGIIRDITERKHMEVMKNEFISTVNHELRTPLTSLRGALAILQAKSAGDLDQKGARLLELASNGAVRLGHLVDDILDIEKIAAGKMEFHQEVVEINELVERVVETHLGIAEKYDVTFEMRLAGGDIFVNLDPSRFNQALVNLLSNAAKFSPAGGAVVIEVASGDGEEVCISVADRGPGIPKDFQDKVFERFTQADSSTTRAEGSSGLGLSITKTIIEAFDGTVSFETGEGTGTTFFFRLPMAERYEGVA